ncbi:MAG TPA: biopolymer transporter ExbD [Candidatus Eisenbacteria bacterium]|nr:biopolymer transporter ExbD [Candidatus Eisenbacteria bacterium]
MRERRQKRRRHRDNVVAEIELMPMLNVFISIIPLLLLSAAFVPVTVIKTTLPSDQAAVVEPQDTPLELAIHIRPAAYQLEVSGSIVQSIARQPRGDEAAATRAREELAQALQGLASAHPDHREVRIVSQPRTRYEEIVEVMDVARSAGLPEASLAEGLEGS